MYGTTARVIEYVVSETLINVVQESAPSLFSWLWPTHPEDIFFIDADHNILLETVSHEAFSTLRCTPPPSTIIQDLLHMNAIVPK